MEGRLAEKKSCNTNVAHGVAPKKHWPKKRFKGNIYGKKFMRLENAPPTLHNVFNGPYPTPRLAIHVKRLRAMRITINLQS